MIMLDAIRFAELKATGRLPSPSGPAMKLIELLGRDDVALPEIVRLVQQDPALTGRILKLANSAAFARPRPAVAISTDILMMIGLPTLRQLVLAFALIDGHHGGPCRAFDYSGFWSRAVARGAAAQTLGCGLRLAPPAELFTLGLVAETGKLALASIEPARFAEVLAKVGADEAALAEAERAAFGFDHQELSIALLRDWGFPALFLDAVRLGLGPEEPPGADNPRLLKLALLLRLADALSRLIEQPDATRQAQIETLQRLARRLEMTPQDFLTLADESLKAWQEWGTLLGVPTLTLTPFSVLEMVIPAGDGAEKEPLRVLVVDDDAALRRLLDHLLGKAGYEVHTASDGAAGFRQALAWRPDIVITDILMPNKDGIRLTHKLRASELGSALYIIVLTILDDEDKLAEAFAAGADDYIPKPVKPRELLARLSAGSRIVRLQKELARRNLELTAALRRAELNALTDSLTGLPNRRYIVERMAQECAAAERSDRRLSLLMLDIDHFKRINDTHGHAVGDAVLQEIARRIEATKRLSDVAARFGGEEFVVLAIDTPLDPAIRLAERLRAAISDLTFAIGDLQLTVTVSIGVAEKAVDCNNLDSLVKAADAALYQAKNKGRNRVETIECHA